MDAAFNKWDFMPISLNRKEINDPFIVIADFFEDDSMDGHLKRLVRWREFILKDDYYHGVNESPHSVYYFFTLILKLVDAAYLIYTACPGSESTVIGVPPLKAVHDRLAESERLKIHSALSSFFADYSLPLYRQQLADWVEHALSNSAANEFITTKDLVTVYDNLQLLISTAWMLLSGHSDLNCEKMETDNVINKPAIREVTLHRLNTELLDYQKATMAAIVNRIKFKLTTVQMIIYLGMQPGSSGRLYFLVITSNSEQRLAQSLASMIEDSCVEIAPVVAIVNHASKLTAWINDDNHFYNHALTCPVIYMTGELMLPAAKPFNLCYSNSALAFNWQRWFSQGTDFLAGADFYIKNGRCGAALFSLHQCAECLLTAVIRGISGYNTSSHNLSRLLTITGMFTEDLLNVFDLKDGSVKERFEVLKHAYINVSYRDNFKADSGAISLLYQDVALLLNMVESVYAKHQLTNSL